MNIKEWNVVFGILEKHGIDWPFAGAEHDVLFIDLSTEEVPEDSEDGKILDELGLHVEEDYWAKFV